MINIVGPRKTYFAADIAAAEFDGRSHENLGSAIMLHGRGGSSGCIAVDNSAIEEIFTWQHKFGIENVQMLIMPWDFRLLNPPENTASMWLQKRYTALQQAVQQYRKIS